MFLSMRFFPNVRMRVFNGRGRKGRGPDRAQFLAGISRGNMAEFATCSQDSLVLWDYKSFVSKNSARPFSGAGYHIQSAGWSASSILNLGITVLLVL